MHAKKMSVNLIWRKTRLKYVHLEINWSFFESIELASNFSQLDSETQIYTPY